MLRTRLQRHRSMCVAPRAGNENHRAGWMMCHRSVCRPQQALYAFFVAGHLVLRPAVCPASGHCLPFGLNACSGTMCSGTHVHSCFTLVAACHGCHLVWARPPEGNPYECFHHG